MTGLPRYLAGLSRNTVLLALSSLFADVSTEMLYPILPIFLTKTLGASGSIVGLVEGCAQAAQNIVQGVSGTISDRLQKRKAVALAGFVVAALSKPLMGVATVWEGVFGARVLDRIGTGTRSAPRDAMVAASVDERNRGRAFGLEGLGDNAGAFIGPLLALFLLYELGVELRTIFYLAVVPGLLAFLMVLLVKERSFRVAAKSKIDRRLAQFPRTYWNYLLATALFGLGNASTSFLILRTQDLGMSLDMTILIYAFFNLAAALISYPAGLLSDRWGRRNLLVAALLVFVITYLGMAFASGAAAMAALFVFYGFYQGTFRSVGKSLAADLVPEHLRATGIGWYSTTVGLLQLAASVIAGLLWDRVGHGAVFYYGAALGAIGTVALVALVPRTTIET